MSDERKPVDELTPQEVAGAISNRLKRLEADTDWNRRTWTDKDGRSHALTKLFHAWAGVTVGGIRMTFITYQGGTVVDVDQARDYLAWLRAGNRGTFHEANHAGAVRPSKKQVLAKLSKEGKDVAYEHSGGRGYRTQVLAAVHVPDGAESVPAADLAEGDRIFYEGRWRGIARVDEYMPPQPEETHALAAQIQHETRLGNYERVEELAEDMQRAARHLREGREFEWIVRLKGNTDVTFTPEAVVGVRRARRLTR